MRSLSRLSRGAVEVAIFAATVFIFWPALRNGFVNWDDVRNITANEGIRALDWPHARWMLTTFFDGKYQPLAWLSYAVDHAFWGLDPRGYHLTNILLHAANAVLVYWLSLRLMGLAAALTASEAALPRAKARSAAPNGKNRAAPVFGAAAAALIFALHPLRVESVAWVTERRDVLCGFFYLLSLLSYLRAQTGGGRPWMILCFLSFLAALASKAMAMTMPFALLVLDFYPLRRLGRGVLKEKAPFAALALLAAGLAALSHSSIHNFHPFSRGLLSVGQVFYGSFFYLAKTAAPWGLPPLHEWPRASGALAWPFAVSAVLVLAATWLLARARRRYPAAWAAWLFYLTALIPVSGLIDVGWHVVADRYSYLPCLGWALLAGAGLQILWGNGRKRLALALVCAVVALFGRLTRRQIPAWRDSETLWTAVLAANPDSVVARVNLAAFLNGQGRAEEAMVHAGHALELDGDSEEAHANLAEALAARERWAEAAFHYRRALMFQPYLPGVSEGYERVRQEAVNRFVRATVDWQQGRLALAAAGFREALAIDPELSAARNNLALILAARGERAAAFQHRGK